jgi:hypothetical protein
MVVLTCMHCNVLILMVVLCRLNTYGAKVLVSGSVKDGNEVTHYPHEYTDNLKNIYLTEFLPSDEHNLLCRIHNKSIIGYSIFKEGALHCPCVRQPTMRFCVDEVETGFNEILNSLQDRRKKNKKTNRCECKFCTVEEEKKEEAGSGMFYKRLSIAFIHTNDIFYMFAAYIHPVCSTMMMLNHLLCNKVPFPAMNGTMPESHVFQKACSCDECEVCKSFLSDESCVLSCPMLFSDTDHYKWKEYVHHELDNGNSIKELREIHGNGKLFKATFEKQLIKYKKHYFTYRWLQFSRRFDVLNATAFDLYIQTDYGAQPVLDSQDKPNSVGHGVCVLSCWLVLHSPQDMEYVDSDSVVHKFKYFQCDHIRVITPSAYFDCSHST